MSSDKFQTYRSLFQAWKDAYPAKPARIAQAECNEFWNKHKTSTSITQAKILELKARKLKSQGTLHSLFSKPPKPPPEQTVTQVPNEAEPNEPTERAESPPKDSVETSNKAKPAQEKLTQELIVISTKILALQEFQFTGLITEEQRTVLKKLKKDKLAIEKKLQEKKRHAQRQTEYRAQKKKKFNELRESHPEIMRDLATPRTAGRPTLESEQPFLLKTIVDLLSPTAAADDRRRSEQLRSCMTLDQLHSEMINLGYRLSRSALYLRLMPRNASTTEGKKHINTVPVKLLRSQNNLRKENVDAHFASSTNKYIRELAEILGPECCLVISQDDKARVPLGLPAANKQAPILMHLEYKVQLPDHDWVVAAKHKLIPSVYAGLGFDASGKLSYSGPTYIAIRSGKHDSSTAETHAHDLRRIMEADNFKQLTQAPGSGNTKPILIIFSDGGPDENPRYPKTLLQMYLHFIHFDFDCVFVSTNAAGYSAYNPVERRMAPLSRQLSGLILPHDHFGSHLDSQGRTVDNELELVNFKKAGEVLAEVWSGIVIDKFDVIAEYLDPDQGRNHTDTPVLTEDWKAEHVRQSHYFLQIVKCSNSSCCKPWRTNYPSLIPERFVPNPVLFHKTVNGVAACEPPCQMNHKHSYEDLKFRLAFADIVRKSFDFQTIPFDLFCPSQFEDLRSRICEICTLSFATKTAKNSHKKIHSNRNKRVPSKPANRKSRVSSPEPVEATLIPVDVHEAEANKDNPEINMDDTDVNDSEADETIHPQEILDNGIEAANIHIIQSLSNWNSATFEDIVES